jgi:enoyl-CoA hydratase/carnithine racemase
LFEAIEVPVIAAVNGPAIGAGCDLACMCDIRIAGESAKFAESFVKLGLVPGDGGAWLLPRVIGFSRACEMAFTGDMIDAAQALACGLVSKVVPDADLLDAARSLAARIAANPPHAVRMTKRLFREAQRASLSAILDTSAAAQALCHATADHHEAVSAFLEKRPPLFKGE